MDQRSAPFIKAILYSDIFDYPLTPDQLWRFAIADTGRSKKDFAIFLDTLPHAIKQKDGYLYLVEREICVTKRKERHIANLQKMAYAQSIADELSRIPTIRCIGVSGGLSLFNAEPYDDIDFFIITAAGTLWLTRLLTILALDRKGIRRKRVGEQKNNSICTNMFVDERALAFAKERHDLYTAHEIVQLVPLVNKHMTYERFITSNLWVKKFLPHALRYKNFPKPKRALQPMPLGLLEKIVQRLQHSYMKRHMTREEVSDTILAFHPVDYKERTLNAFAKRLAQYEKI